MVVVFVIFGAPAAGGTVPSAFLPEFWRIFGPYLPAGAGTTAVRNTVYFGGNEIGISLLVLAGYLVAGALVVMARRRKEPQAPPRRTPKRQLLWAVRSSSSSIARPAPPPGWPSDLQRDRPGSGRW